MNDDVGTLIEPEPIAFTLGAPGWYVVGGLIMLLIILVAVVLFRHHQKNKYRTRAIQWLKQRESQLLPQHPTELIYDAAILMKRIAATRYSRSDVAGLLSREWIAFLNRTCKSEPFEERDVEWLQQTLYAPMHQLQEREVRIFLKKTEKWIKHHRYAL
jgi:hypothetical protein